MDADRALAMKGATVALAGKVIDRAGVMAETGKIFLVLSFHRGQLHKAEALRASELGSVADGGSGRIAEKG